MSDTKSAKARGRKGGQRTAKLYGKEHFAEIGKRGADRVAEILKAGKRALAVEPSGLKEAAKKAYDALTPSEQEILRKRFSKKEQG